MGKGMPRIRKTGVEYLAGEKPAVPLQTTTKIHGLFRFGEDLELDRFTGRLSRTGLVLRLERIPTEVLLFLIEQRGELVTREQIVERIWGKDVFFDTDNSINGAIRKVRQVLRDDSEQPRFIQTITRKGYRFIAPVLEVSTKPEQRTPAMPAPVHKDPPNWFARRLRPAFLAVAILMTIVALVAIVGPNFRWSKSQARTLRSGRTMLAVLPFDNLTGDAGQEYLSDGMTEEMISELGSQNPNHLGVIARTSVMHYKHSHEELPEIAHELGVQYVLEGSVRSQGSKVRITAQLIQMRDQTRLWAREYDGDVKDLLWLQGEIAKEISGEIQTALGEGKFPAPSTESALSPQAYQAYDLYLKGQYFLNKRTVQGFEEAIRFFQKATSLAPKDARAYAGLADSYALIESYSAAPPAKFASQARAAALRAVELDDRLPEAHAALALIVQNHDYDWQTAEKEFKRAIELNPNYATAHHWYAEHLAWRGRFEEALRESERARQLDPLSLIIRADNGVILYYSRDYGRAIAQFTAVREMDPDFPRAQMIYAAYLQKGMFAEASAEIQRRFNPSVPWDWFTLADTYSRSGRTRDSQNAVEELLKLNRHQALDPIVIADAYSALRDNNDAIAWLEKAYAQRSNGLTALKVDPIYDPLRGDARFQDLLQRVGLAQ
jgi:TolB-like protein/DNA-binding winged helix-turn-helix (wHTH) protein/Flp pilus assembly protein TadD